LYDLGQIGSDYARLAGATALRSGWCLILVFGPLVADAASASGVLRHFCNLLFVDYEISRRFGEIAEDPIAKQWTMEAAAQMKLDQPFAGRSGADFCVRTQTGDLGLIGLSVEKQ
jgi:hypothetical protein